MKFGEYNEEALCKELNAELQKIGSALDFYQHKWVSYADQLNWGLQNTGIDTEWSMRMDADEEIMEDLADYLCQLYDTALYNGNDVSDGFNKVLKKELKSVFISLFGYSWDLDKRLYLRYEYATGIWIDVKLNDKGKKQYALNEIQKVAALMRFELERGKIDEFADLLNYHWELSRKVDAGSTNTLIDQIFLSIEDLIDAKMVCGAGGGGFLQVILKKGVQKADVHKRLKDVFQDNPVDVWDCEII